MLASLRLCLQVADDEFVTATPQLDTLAQPEYDLGECGKNKWVKNSIILKISSETERKRIKVPECLQKSSLLDIPSTLMHP